MAVVQGDRQGKGVNKTERKIKTGISAQKREKKKTSLRTLLWHRLGLAHRRIFVPLSWQASQYHFLTGICQIRTKNR